MWQDTFISSSSSIPGSPSFRSQPTPRLRPGLELFSKGTLDLILHPKHDPDREDLLLEPDDSSTLPIAMKHTKSETENVQPQQNNISS